MGFGGIGLYGFRGLRVEGLGFTGSRVFGFRESLQRCKGTTKELSIFGRQRRSEPWFEPLRLRGTSWFRVEGLGLGVRLYTPRAW